MGALFFIPHGGLWSAYVITARIGKDKRKWHLTSLKSQVPFLSIGNVEMLEIGCMLGQS